MNGQYQTEFRYWITQIKPIIVTWHILHINWLRQLSCFIRYEYFLSSCRSGDSEALQDMVHNPCSEPDWDLRRWRPTNIYLVELRNVSIGSWQPVLSMQV
jgi:hypothetical protein